MKIESVDQMWKLCSITINATQYLLEISSQCQKAGSKFLEYLDRLLSNSSSSNPLRNAGISIKFAFLHSKIEDFASKLDKLRSALLLASILAFRASSNISTETIIGHLERLQHDSQNQGVDNAELLKATQMLADIQGQTVPKLDAIQEQVQESLEQLNALRDDRSKARERAILQWLDFRQMTWRHEEVPSAYGNTFRWIFDGPSQSQTCDWDDFVTYLSGPNTTMPYFINGKAGSGKSTLMKYIIGHRRTEEALCRWAGNGELIIAKYFFWNLGTELQRTTVGMLRGLLHEVLTRYPELIPAVFSGMYQSWADGPAKDSQPNIIEVKSAFKRLLQASAKFLKLCIFVDGIDETDDDHRELSEFMFSLALKHVKVIVSGRAIPVCTTVFYGCPSLKLQNLTKSDMELYVKENLVAHRSMVALSKQFPVETSKLVVELKEKAAGVFLWVTLVVRLLLDGIEAGDDVRDLQRKLRSLPGGLRELYRRMMSKMDPDHQSQAAEIFQLLRTWHRFVPDQPLRTIMLSFAIQNPRKAFSQSTEPLDKETYQWLCRNVEARVSSRCCGLLDVYTKTEGSTQDRIHGQKEADMGSVVDYLHRTVAEFLASGDVWSEICSMTKDTDFDAAICLASAGLSSIKIRSQYPDNVLVELIHALSALYRSARPFSDVSIQRKYVDATDQAVTSIQKRFAPLRDNHWSADLFPALLLSKDDDVDQLRKSASIFSFAARAGFHSYMYAFWSPKIGTESSRLAIMRYALDGWSNHALRESISLDTRTKMMLQLFRFVALPGTNCLGRTPWRIIVTDLCPILTVPYSVESDLPEAIGHHSEDIRDLFGFIASPTNQEKEGSISRRDCRPQSQYLLDYVVLVAVCLVAMPDPELLLEDIPVDQELDGMVPMLKSAESTILQDLGQQVEPILNSLRKSRMERAIELGRKIPNADIFGHGPEEILSFSNTETTTLPKYQRKSQPSAIFSAPLKQNPYTSLETWSLNHNPDHKQRKPYLVDLPHHPHSKAFVEPYGLQQSNHSFSKRRRESSPDASLLGSSSPPPRKLHRSEHMGREEWPENPEIPGLRLLESEEILSRLG